MRSTRFSSAGRLVRSGLFFDKAAWTWHACPTAQKMKLLLILLVLGIPGLAAERPKVSDCFKVHSLTRMDDEHYWANWTNACPYTIDSVYVMIGFADKSRKVLGEGVWGLHFITQGMHRVIRFSTPSRVDGFEFVSVRKITTDAAEALR
jgi:hypothetical protein